MIDAHFGPAGGDAPPFFGRRQPPPHLPVAWSPRFAPLRAGILNVWQYDEQEFRFERGHLLLRGDNATGKSKALELLLPFLLDADLSPQRLDPFAGTARTMYWNLLQGDRHENRIGYVWLELGRRLGEDDAGREHEDGRDEEHWTIGCGLRATRRTQRVDSWYFVSRRRVGLDLALLSPQRVPLLKEELRKAIGSEGDVYDTGHEYRERLDHLFFNLGEERFAALRHLLLQLRRPQLSQKLDPHSLGELLTESLPPLDADLIGQLSETFERLDQDQRELARVEAAAREVEAFLSVYRDYARGIARGHAAEVRQADSRYHKTAAEARDAEAKRERMAAQEADLAARRDEVEQAVDATRGELQALAASESMRSAEVLRARRERADDLDRHAAAAAVARTEGERAAVAAQGEDERAATEAREAAEERESETQRASAAAEDAGLEAVHSAAVEALAATPAAAEATARAGVARRREAVSEVQRLAAGRDRAREDHGRAEERRAEADARWRLAAARTAAAERELERAREDLDAALIAWRGGLAELGLDEPGFAALRETALAAEGPAGEASPLEAAAVLARIAEPQRDRRVREIRDEEEAAHRLVEERQGNAKERDRVAAARELGPEPPRTREAPDRLIRPGAPFYLLCDFSTSLGEEQRAGLEASLEAAGLLDAWVTPDGGLLAPGTLDAVLVPSPRDGPGTLADLLVATPGHGVERELIEAVLRSLDLPEVIPETEAGHIAHWLGRDGSWRLGPLWGAWRKDAAEHVGAAAREATRRRRLAELDARLAELDMEIATAEARCETLRARLARLRREIEALPPAEPLRRTRLAARAAGDEEARRHEELATAEAAATAARQALDLAERRLASRARELGLADRLEDLTGYLLRLERYVSAFDGLSRAVRTAAAAAARREEIAHRLAAASERREEALRQAREAAALARQARAEVDTLEATVGEAARRIVEQHAAARRRLEGLERDAKGLATEREEAAMLRIRAEAQAESHRHQLEERDADRQASVEGLRGVAGAGLLDLVLDRAAEEVTAELAAGWSFTRALELARTIERSTAEVDLGEEAVRRRVNRFHERYQHLMTDLGADYQPSLYEEKGLVLVRILYNGREHAPTGLLALLREAAEIRRGLLAEHERDLLRRFLLGEVGDHLRRRLRQAGELVDEINDQLAHCATASGLVLRLAWRPDAEADPAIREVMELLRRDPDLLPEEGKRRLEAFFQRQIETAREQWETVPWRQHLMRVLDYRRWHRFGVQRRGGSDGAWQDLTRHGHAAISGGEKAVALHLPLFAAAAAHYRSARDTAPRLILLDEAFAGIDQAMRGRCMGLLTGFDLDFMMTSYEEWGCYEELPGLAVYQLYRDPAFEGVAAVPFLWNGRSLQEGRQAGEET